MKAAPDDIIKDIVDFLDFPEDTKQKVEEARTNVKCKWKNLKTTKFIDLLERTCRNYPVMCTERQAEEWFDAVRAELLIDVDNIDEVDAARFIQFVTNYKMMIDGQNWQSGETVCSVVKRIYDDLILFMGLQASLIRKGEKIFKIRWKSRYQKSGSDGFHEMCASPDLLLTTIYPRSVQDRLTASSNAMVPVLVMEVCGSTMEEVQFLNEETLHAESGSGSSSSSEKSSSERPTKKARLQELPNTLHAQHFSKLLLTQHNALVSKDAYGWANLPEMYRKRSLHILPGMVVTRNGVFMTKLVSQVGHICDISEIDQAVTKERFNSTEDDRYCVSDRFLVLHHHWKALCHYLLLLNELGCLFVTKPKSLA